MAYEFIDDEYGSYLPQAQPRYNGYDDITDMGEVARLQSIYESRPDLRQQWADAIARGEQPFDLNPLQFIKYATQDDADPYADPNAPVAAVPSPPTGQQTISDIVTANPSTAFEAGELDRRLTDASTDAQVQAAIARALAGSQGRIARGRFADVTGIAGQGYTQSLADLAANRDARFANADRTYQDMSGYLEGDYATRRRLNRDEADAWDAGAQVARDRTIDQVFSRGGVTGLIGQTTRNAGQVNQDYARDRALRYAQGERQAFEPYSQGRMTLRETLGANRDAIQNQYGTGNQAAGQSYFANVGNASDSLWDSYAGTNADFYSNLGQIYTGYSQQRTGAKDAYGSRWQSNYADTMDQYGRDAQTGYNATANTVNANADATQQTARYRADSAQNTGAARLAGADAWAGAFNNSARAIGDAWGQNRRRNAASQNVTFQPIGGRATPSYTDPYASYRF